MEKSTRRPVFDEGKQREVCAMLSVGCSRAVAAQYVGCSVDTIRRTAKRDPAFALALERAECYLEVANLTNINQAGKVERHWRAAVWALERTRPDRYAARRPRTLSLDQMSAVLAQFADALLEELPDEEARRRITARLSELAAQFDGAAAKGGGA